MFAIVGAAGNVGYSTSCALRRSGVPVRAILRDEAKAARLEAIGCDVALADLQDARALAEAMGDVAAVQIVVPLRPQAEDPAADMRRSVESLVEALALTRPDKALAISDYGAHVEHDIGMPSIFRELEARICRLPCSTVILRSAEHMHNWVSTIPASLASGTLPSFQDPLDRAHPMISAQDLGQISADLLMQSRARIGGDIIHAEGPRRSSANDVASVLSQLSGQRIHAEIIPRSEWARAFARMPASLAKLLIRANDAKNEGGLIDIEPKGEVRYGSTSLIDELRPILAQSGH